MDWKSPRGPSTQDQGLPGLGIRDPTKRTRESEAFPSCLRSSLDRPQSCAAALLACAAWNWRPDLSGPGSATCGQRPAAGRGAKRLEGVGAGCVNTAVPRLGRNPGIFGLGRCPGAGVLVVRGSCLCRTGGWGDSGARALPSFATENHLVLLPPPPPSPFPRQVRAQTRECEHTPADTQRRSQASTWRR